MSNDKSNRALMVINRPNKPGHIDNEPLGIGDGDPDMGQAWEKLLASMRHPKKREFLQKYLETGRLCKSAKAVGSHRYSIVRWRKADEAFDRAINLITDIAEKSRLERHEIDIDAMAFDPKIPAQTRALCHFFVMKALDSRYKDRVTEQPVTKEISQTFVFVLPDGTKVKPKELGTFKEVEAPVDA